MQTKLISLRDTIYNAWKQGWWNCDRFYVPRQTAHLYKNDLNLELGDGWYMIPPIPFKVKVEIKD